MSNKLFYVLLIVVAFISLVLGTLNQSALVPVYVLAVIVGAVGLGREILIDKLNKQINEQYKGVINHGNSI